MAKRDRVEAAEQLERIAAAVEAGDLADGLEVALGLLVGADALRSVR